MRHEPYEHARPCPSSLVPTRYADPQTSTGTSPERAYFREPPNPPKPVSVHSYGPYLGREHSTPLRRRNFLHLAYGAGTQGLEYGQQRIRPSRNHMLFQHEQKFHSLAKHPEHRGGWVVRVRGTAQASPRVPNGFC